MLIKSEQLRMFDVDGTLVYEPTYVLGESNIDVYDVISGKMITRAINLAMVRLLIEEHHRGSYIVVWSRGGWEWAQAVITALDLTHEVRLIMSKPMVYFDDQDVSAWMKDRVFIEPNINYKRN